MRTIHVPIPRLLFSRHVCISETGTAHLQAGGSLGRPQLRTTRGGLFALLASCPGYIMHVCLVEAGRAASITEFCGSVRWLGHKQGRILAVCVSRLGFRGICSGDCNKRGSIRNFLELWHESLGCKRVAQKRGRHAGMVPRGGSHSQATSHSTDEQHFLFHGR